MERRKIVMNLTAKFDDFANRYRLYYVIPFCFFIFMMAFQITHSAPWGDEWNEYRISQKSIGSGEMYRSIINTYQPPLYNFLMHFWLKFGTSVLWFRSMNLVLGTIAGLFLFSSLKKLYNEKIAGITLMFLAVCFHWVYCIQECSEYALMLCAIFASLYFYILCFEQFGYVKMSAFLLCSVAAIYSQYGSVFVILPLLALFFIKNVFDKRVPAARKVILCASYLACLLVFAAPLYFYYLKIQLGNNEIGGSKVTLSPELFMDFPFTLGKITGYFFHLQGTAEWTGVFCVLSLLIITAAVLLLRRNSLGWIKNSIILCTLIAYAAHFLLVQLHIYAMVHPDMSAGFYERYSYFYIPLLSLLFPVLVVEYGMIVKEGRLELCRAVLLFLSCAIFALSMFATLQNWHKAYDDQFAEIWLEHEGWKDTTYLYGKAKYGFEYYISHSDQFEESFFDNVHKEVDNKHLAPRFWAWRTNWGGEGWQDTIDTARALGYKVTIYNDSGYAGQLAFCSSERSGR